MLAPLPPSGVISLLRPYMDLVVLVFFIGFFLAALAAIVCNENRYVRGAYVGGFISLLLVTNTVVPVAPAPLIQWHKFSEIRPTEQTRHEIRIVDASGNEIRYDDKATWKTNGVAMRTVRKGLLRDATPKERREIARYLLRKAREHRTHLRDRSPLHVFRFPPHGTANTWTVTELDAYDRFVGIRLYRMEFVTSPDGTEVTDYTEEVVYEYVSNETIGTASEATAGEMIANPSVVRSLAARPLPGAGMST